MSPKLPESAKLKRRSSCPYRASAASTFDFTQGVTQVQPAQELRPSVASYDFLVVGSGIAGLSYALKVAEYGSVAVVTKEQADEGCTAYAQGGISAVLDVSDSVENHVHDTLRAGAYLNSVEAVEAVCREGPGAVLELVEMGANFTKGPKGDLHLTREGGHSHRRVVHAADLTGKEVERALLAAAHRHPNISILEHHLAVDLVCDRVAGAKHCLGLDVLDTHSYQMQRLVAPVTMLASGGAGQVYPNTTNPHVTTGDGIAMAYRAKAVMADMEFIQFHPTGFFQGARAQGQTFLISEAVRGEGGLLYNLDGRRFMSKYDDRLELAPRDVVARSIHDQMMTRGESHVMLDISHCPRDLVTSHFPNILARCASHGVDITREPIPVVPTQHYMCGGIQTGLLGDTGIAGLFACGEVACTGLHGANRLASNSLLEGLVFASRAVKPSVAHQEYALKHAGLALHHAALSADFTGASSATRLPEMVTKDIQQKRQQMTSLMWNAAGIVRHSKEMRSALHQLRDMYIDVRAMRQEFGIAPELQELLNLVTVGELIMASAFSRQESRGLHYNADFPQLAEHGASTVITDSFRRRHGVPSLIQGTPAPGISNLVPAPAGTVSVSEPNRRRRKNLSRNRDLTLTRAQQPHDGQA
ncbi:hypothetical protein WJX84_007128 [Apatococcus fuscideae]|uniref:L-aspartate oxidase n=1 Tax=Apatococcus fuscideae TaxID=2026836 RepID=A0AAW1SK45_9CHLO